MIFAIPLYWNIRIRTHSLRDIAANKKGEATRKRALAKGIGHLQWN